MSDARLMHPDYLRLLSVHPYADEFPYLTDAETLELAQDIEANGLHHPIVLHQVPDAETGELVDELLDGRNRLAALGQTNLTAVPVEYYEGDDPVDFIVSLNLARRHLTTGQRAALAVAALPYYEAAAELRMKAGVQSDQSDPSANSQQGRSVEAVADRFGVGSNAVSRAKALSLNTPDLFTEMKAGLRTVNNAYDAMKKRQDGGAGLAKDGYDLHPLIAAADRILERLAGLRGDLRKQDSLGRSALDLMASHEQVELFAILAKVGELADL